MSRIKEEVSKVNKLKLSINGREGRIRIGWGVADILRESQFLSIYMSPNNDAIMVKPCDEKEFLSIKIEDRKDGKQVKELLLYSLAFVSTLMEQQGWVYTKTYHMTGKYVEGYNAVVFLLKEATVVDSSKNNEQ